MSQYLKFEYPANRLDHLNKLLYDEERESSKSDSYCMWIPQDKQASSQHDETVYFSCQEKDGHVVLFAHLGRQDIQCTIMKKAEFVKAINTASGRTLGSRRWFAALGK